MKKRMIVCIVIAGVLIGTTACAGTTDVSTEIKEVSESAFSAPQTTTVLRGDVEVYTTLQGVIAPEVTQLTFPSEGSFGNYEVKVGDHVEKGQILAVSETSALERQLETLENSLESLTSGYEYKKASSEITTATLQLQIDELKASLEGKAVTAEYTATCLRIANYDESRKREELVMQQATETYEQESAHLQEQIKEIETKVRSNKIVAPCDGTIIALAKETANASINLSYDYVSIAKDDTCLMQSTYVSEASINRLEKVEGFWNGQKYELTYIPWDEKTYLKMKNNEETIYSFYSIVNRDEAMAYGDYVVIMLYTGTAHDVLYVPKLAISSDSTGKYVYRKNGDLKEKVYITTDLSSDISTVVTSGLEEGDVIYVQD